MMKALISSLFLIVFLFSAGCGAGNESGVKIDGKSGVSAAIALTEAHIKSIEQAIEVMAMTEELKSGSWEKIFPMLSKFKQTQIPAVIFFASPDGSYYTVDLGKTDKNISDRAYFQKVMAGEKALGDLLVSKTTGERVVVVCVPVIKETKVIAALGVSVYLEKLSETIVKDLQLSNDMTFYAVNDQGKIVLHTKPEWILRDAAELGSESFSNAVKEMTSKQEGFVMYKLGGLSEQAVFKASSLTGWRFALGLRK